MSRFSFYGNAKTVSFLQHIVANKQFHHAYLFLGEEGVGKRTLAAQFAQAVLCQGNCTPAQPCISCKKIEKGIHPDCSVLGQSDGKNTFHAEEVRALRKSAVIKPNESAYRIYILQNAQNMSPTAAAALLKLLEEPPVQVIFLLTATDKEALLPTISSRCVCIPISPLCEPECVQAVARLSNETSREKLDRVSCLCGGNIGKALRYLAEDSDKDALHTAQKLEAALCAPQDLALLLAAAPMEQSREAALEALSCLLDRLRFSIRNKAMHPEQSTRLGAHFPTEKLLQMAQVTQDAMAALEQNANPRLLVTWFCTNVKEEGVL